MFSEIKVGQDINLNELNQKLKNLYDTNFFSNVSLNFDKNIFLINVEEAPLIDNIIITGIKAQKYKDLINQNLILKPRTSYNEFLLKKEISSIIAILKSQGFYFAKIEPYLENLDNNLINVEFKIDLGDRAKISKISFIGDKIYKNRKLSNVIVSEEYKFWKFISGKKYLQEQLIELDRRLLTNFYLNRGFYNVKVNSSFAKLSDDNKFELIFNITPSQKVYFNDLNIALPIDLDKKNYSDLIELFSDLKGKPYSINSVQQILDQIDQITIDEEFKTVKATVDEEVINNKLNINFLIEESEKFFIERINIYGNNVTRENVIRNQLEIDEGDPFSDLLIKKSENNIKSLNFFKNVKTKVIDGKNVNSKIINYEIEEKPTGEISAGAGAGTDGGTFFFGVRENNYLGKGLGVDVNATISEEALKGTFSITNPNYNNSDKSLYTIIEAIEIDQLENYGYKTSKTGFAVGTSFEYFKNFNLGLSTSTYFETIDTDSTASSKQKSQAGNYVDTFLKFNLDLDKRNQKFRTSEGFRSTYNLNMPIVSDTNTLTNSYNYKIYSELYEDNISSISLLLKSANSLTGDDIKLTERLSIPSSRLRGFERGKVGPKDEADFIGGNFMSVLNIQSNIPKIFENFQNLDAVIFFDAANVWGVDYDSSLNDGNKIRTSIGIGVDWLTPVGPLNFSLTEAITKSDTDIEESFRFNLGTTF
jgi:outer membrane protein insertion porin family